METKCRRILEKGFTALGYQQDTGAVGENVPLEASWLTVGSVGRDWTM